MAEVRGTPFAVAAARAVRNNISTSPIAFPMADTPTPEVRVNASAGHLSVHVPGAHPIEIPFLFEQQQKRIPSALAGSLASHIVLAALVIFGVRYGGATAVSPALLPDQPNTNIIWLSQPGPGGGGGGGGNGQASVARITEPSGQVCVGGGGGGGGGASTTTGGGGGGGGGAKL